MFTDKRFHKNDDAKVSSGAVVNSMVLSETEGKNNIVQNAGGQGVPVESIIDIIGDRSNIVSTIILLSYIRHILNTGSKGEIKVKVGYNKPPSIPFNFAVNEQTVDDYYPGEVLEIN